MESESPRASSLANRAPAAFPDGARRPAPGLPDPGWAESSRWCGQGPHLARRLDPGSVTSHSWKIAPSLVPRVLLDEAHRTNGTKGSILTTASRVNVKRSRRNSPRILRLWPRTRHVSSRASPARPGAPSVAGDRHRPQTESVAHHRCSDHAQRPPRLAVRVQRLPETSGAPARRGPWRALARLRARFRRVQRRDEPRAEPLPARAGPGAPAGL